MKKTNRSLRAWKISDLNDLVAVANNWNIAKYLTDGFPFPYTNTDGEEFIRMALVSKENRFMAIDVDGRAVGGIGVFPQKDIYRKNAELGYWLAEPYWNQGIMTWAVLEMVDWAFSNLSVTRIFARPFGSNIASHRVLQKAGFQLETRFYGVIFKNDRFEDEWVFAIRKTF